MFVLLSSGPWIIRDSDGPRVTSLGFVPHDQGLDLGQLSAYHSIIFQLHH